MRHLVVTGSCITVLLACGEAMAEPVPLWGGVSTEDAPAAVVARMLEMPEVKRATFKLARGDKSARISLTYKDSGIAILDDPYEAEFEFAGDSLRGVKLYNGNQCRNTIRERYARLIGVLKEKYPNLPLDGFGEIDSGRFLQAEAKSLDGLEPSVGTVLDNGTTAVFVQVKFVTMTPPGVVFGTGLARSLNDLQWSLYRIRAEQCGGTGASRAMLMIRYMPKDELQRIISETEAEIRTKNETAKKRL